MIKMKHQRHLLLSRIFSAIFFLFTLVTPNIPAVFARTMAAAPLGQTIWLRANANNQYVSADQNLANTQLIANRPSVQGWEQFTVVDAGGGLIALRASNGMYVSADTNLAAYAPLVANRPSVQGWETFTWTDAGAGQMTLKASSTGKFVSADGNRSYNLVADRATAGGWETFTWGAVGTVPTPVPTQTGPTPNFGSNVLIFDPSMSTATIQSQINTVYASQQNAQFGNGRYALVFKPGTYNVDIPVGFYTEVLGLGSTPNSVNITGNLHSDSYLSGNNSTCNFWRGVTNLTVTPNNGTVKWAVSQATWFRNMKISGNLVLHQNGGWASGGWMSNSLVTGSVDSGPQQQWITRNSQWAGWTGSNWNMVFVGVTNAPAGTWPSPAYTKIAQTPVVREKPFLQIDAAGNYSVRKPSLKSNSSGYDWAGGSTPGTDIPISQFYIARAGVDTAATINAQLAAGKHLLLTPGIYPLNDTIRVNNPNTIVLGMGFATLRPDTGLAAMTVADVDGVTISGVLFDAGATNSPVLLEVGPSGSSASHAANPIVLHDVIFRVGGAAVGKATVSFRINAHDTIVDQTWVWRADHGENNSVGWTINTAANGLVVNGNNVTIYGLFVEHYQQYQVIWNGNGGRTYFYQSELPYDPPTQSSWTSASGVNGWASYKVGANVTSHEAWGLGIYAVFTNGGVFLTRALEVPAVANVKFHSIITVNILSTGNILNVINNTGGSTGPNVSITPRITNFP